MQLIIIKLLIINKNHWLGCFMVAEIESCRKILKAIREGTYCNTLYPKNMAILLVLNYNYMHFSILQPFKSVILTDTNMDWSRGPPDHYRNTQRISTWNHGDLLPISPHCCRHLTRFVRDNPMIINTLRLKDQTRSTHSITRLTWCCLFTRVLLNL